MSTLKKASRNRPLKEVAYGNLDKNQDYPITMDAIEKGLYVLRHFKNFAEAQPNGTSVDSGIEDPSTQRIGVYTQNTYDEYVRENEKEGKVNTFHKMLGKYVVLHDPTIEAPAPKKVKDSSTGGEDINSLTNAQLKELLSGFELSEDDAKALKTGNKESLIGLVTKYQTNTNN